MALLEDVANRVAARTLRLIEETGDEDLEKKVADQIGASSPTLQEAFTTALRILKAEARASRFIDKIEGVETAEVVTPAPAAPTTEAVEPAPEPKQSAPEPSEPEQTVEEATPIPVEPEPAVIEVAPEPEQAAPEPEEEAPLPQAEPAAEQEPDMIEHLIALGDDGVDPFEDDDDILALPSPSAAN